MSKVVVLGTAQDGGVPHAGCKEACCESAWKDVLLHRYPSSIAAVCEESKKFWIFDATPDIKHQLNILNKYKSNLSGIFLTHAHIGHFAGLTSLGLEIMNLKGISVYVMPIMEKFLKKSPFIKSLINEGVIKVRSISDKQKISVGPFLVEPFNVPHRNELSETVGYKVSASMGSIVYLPDIDAWQGWEKKLFSLVEENNYLFIDGTYFKKNEIKKRNIKEIPHPSIYESMKLLSCLDSNGKNKIYFTHFNHTNSVIHSDPSSGRLVAEKGFNLLKEKKVFKI